MVWCCNVELCEGREATLRELRFVKPTDRREKLARRHTSRPCGDHRLSLADRKGRLDRPDVVTRTETSPQEVGV